MKDDTKAAREAQIFAAAYDVLGAKGYGGTSMLAVARAAKASNETMYRWYGNKRGLFGAMVAANANAIRNELTDALQNDQDPQEVLRMVGPMLLSMLLGDRAVLLNRAAAADPTGELGAALAEHGRASVGPLVAQVIKRALPDGCTIPARQATEWFFGLLIGDSQIRRVTGALGPLSGTEIETRANAAITAWTALVFATIPTRM